MMQDNNILHHAGIPLCLDHTDDIHRAVKEGLRLPDAAFLHDSAHPARRLIHRLGIDGCNATIPMRPKGQERIYVRRALKLGKIQIPLALAVTHDARIKELVLVSLLVPVHQERHRQRHQAMCPRLSHEKDALLLPNRLQQFTKRLLIDQIFMFRHIPNLLPISFYIYIFYHKGNVQTIRIYFPNLCYTFYIIKVDISMPYCYN